MIRSLIIGNEPDVKRYSNILGSSKYFGIQEHLLVAENKLPLIPLSEKSFDALFLVSNFINAYSLFESAIKTKSNFYFVDQQKLSLNELIRLNDLFLEAGNMMFPEILELEHPLMEEFISTKGSYLLFRYTKSVANKKLIRGAILSALSFLSLLSPMQVKKIDVNSLDTSETGRPVFKIRLKMYDSSVAYVILKLENKEEQSILIESQDGSFLFNLQENYLENIHGIRFYGEPITPEKLLLKNLEAFGLNIILNKDNKFNFNHYYLSVKSLLKISSILENSL